MQRQLRLGVLLLAMHLLCRGSKSLDVRTRLSTKTRYAWRLPIPNMPSINSHPDPDGYAPHHLWLLSRHGTRWPTKDRMAEINTLDRLFKDATNKEDHPWIQGWRSPVHALEFASGDLHSIGGDEMWALAQRLSKRFPTLSADLYFPKRYSIVSTQVPRTAASANAFASGFFPLVQLDPEALLDQKVHEEAIRRMSLSRHSEDQPSMRAGSGYSTILDLGQTSSRPQAVSLTMSPKDSDPLLRFFDTCPEYASHEKHTKKWLASWMVGNWTRLAPRLERRLGMNRSLDPCEVEALWQLCLTEAGLQGKLDQACSLFTPGEAAMLEWMDDVSLMEGHGYGSRINYEIASPLLHDLHDTLKTLSEEEESISKARLLFGHCETLIPLAALMGLFREDAEGRNDRSLVSGIGNTDEVLEALWQDDETDAIDVQTIHTALAKDGDGTSICKKGKSVKPDSTPVPEGWRPTVPFRDDRMWRGSRIAPYGANLAVVLYREKGRGGSRSAHKVRLIYNEQVIPIPSCLSSSSGLGKGDSSDSPPLDCDLDEFLEIYRQKADLAIMERECYV